MLSGVFIPKHKALHILECYCKLSTDFAYFILLFFTILSLTEFIQFLLAERDSRFVEWRGLLGDYRAECPGL